MPRYFIDATDRSGRLVRDEVGELLSDDAAAWQEALSQIRSIEQSLRPGSTWCMTVRDCKRVVFEFDFTCRADNLASRFLVPDRAADGAMLSFASDPRSERTLVGWRI